MAYLFVADDREYLLDPVLYLVGVGAHFLVVEDGDGQVVTGCLCAVDCLLQRVVRQLTSPNTE